MILLRHLCRVLSDVTTFAVNTRKPVLVVIVIAGFLAVLLALTAQAAAPVFLYPFA